MLPTHTHKILIALTQDLALRDLVQQAVHELGYGVVWVSNQDLSEPIDFLVAHQPVLVLVDVAHAPEQWREFVTVAKTSPATRKMPLLLIGNQQDARGTGANAVVSRSAFLNDVHGHIQQNTRPDNSTELLRQAALPLPELARKAIAEFNAHEFWEQHETFEALWRAEAGPVRQMYQGILQVGVAYLQIQRKNYVGARKLFQRARQYLLVLPNVCQSVNMAQLRADAQAAQAELERLGAERIDEFDAAWFKPVLLVDN